VGYILLCLSVDIEEWHHYLWPYRNKATFESSNSAFYELTFLEPLRRILEIFENHGVKSTFFVLGEVAKSYPEVVEKIYDFGHEIASHGYCHKDLTRVNKNDFEKMEKMNRELLAKITGHNPKGFRSPMFNVNTAILNSLEKIGYSYDSSVVPSIKIPGWFGFPNAPMHPYHPSIENGIKTCEERDFYEVPIAVFPLLRLPAGGGWFLRNLGTAYIRTAVKLLLSKGYPVILYIHLQDLSSVKPRIDGVPFHEFRNCGKYALKAIENILRNIKVRKMPICDIISALEPSNVTFYHLI